MVDEITAYARDWWKQRRRGCDLDTTMRRVFANGGWAWCPEMMNQLCADFDPALFFLLRWKNDVKRKAEATFEGWQVMSAKVKRENSVTFKMYSGRRSWTTCCIYFRSTSSSFDRSFLDHGSLVEGRFGVMFVTVTALSGISFIDSSWVVLVWTFFVHRGDTHHFCYFGRRVSETSP